MGRGVLRGMFAAIMLSAVVFAGVVAAPSAGAQTQVFSCSYTVGPQVLPEGGGLVTVSGTAPGTSVVRIFVDGVQAAVTTAAPVTGQFSADIFITQSVEVSVGVDDYPNTPCIGVGGESVERDDSGIVVGGASTSRSRALAYTGASDTGRFVLIGVSAISLGAVLVVAARRRQGVRGRS